jgi:hypothetical protein
MATAENPSRMRLPGGGIDGRQGPHTLGGRYGYRLDHKREEAAKRTEARAKRSPQDQLAILDQRLGEGRGAKKERAKLRAEIKKK